MQTIQEIKNLKDKIVLLRGDLDVPIKNGKILDNFRLLRMLPSIKYLIEKRAHVKIIGHLGRPGGEFAKKLSLRPVAEELRKLLNVNKKEIRNWKTCPLDELGAGTELVEGLEISKFDAFYITMNICLLENLRFYKGEEKNDPKFAKKLAELGDIFVNECFSTSHRKHASFVGIPKYLSAFAGLNLADEVKYLSRAMENPKRPAVAILGGAKLETKMPLIKKLSANFDYILVGGKLGLEMSSKKQQNNKTTKQTIILPVDYVGAGKFDIGERTIKLYCEILSKAKTIIWNGPMGKYEERKYIAGTCAIATAIAESKAFSIVGGGDVIAALGKLKMLGHMDFVSTGGGAMLEFLEKGILAGIEALQV